MIFRDPRYRRRLTPSVNLLESRRLLSFVVASDGQHGSDFVGPDTSQGSDGIMDVHLALTGLSHTDVNYITVQGPPGFEWQTAPSGTTYNSVGYAFAEFFQNPLDKFEGDLYINPQVKSDLPPPGGSLPLGDRPGL